MLYILQVSVRYCHKGKNFKTFDPYEILELDLTATDAQIRRAYRQLARKFHPDKNHGDPNASKEYILVNKAYQCLENEEAR